VAARIARLTGRLRDGLDRLGCPVASRGDGDTWSGIVSFTDPRRDCAELVRELVEQEIHVSYPDGLVRVSPHYWTTEAEIDLLLNALAGERRRTVTG
jgi:cysteine desulfurase/selenocysteine lyase